jgi:DNA-binding protein HU-beta
MVSALCPEDVIWSYTARFLEAFARTIHAEMHSAEKILIPEVGTLHVTHRSARKDRNLATGEEIQIAARRVVTFKATKTLQDRVNS